MSYLDKWQDFSTHNDWSKRTESLSKFIPQHTSSILELGSGKNHLRALKLIDLENISYRSSDISFADGIDEVIDLNAETLPRVEVELIFYSGLIEYIFDLPRFFNWAMTSSKIMLGTYSPILTSPLSIDESIRRSNNGWKNHLCLTSLHSLAYKSGWSLEFKERHQEQILFVGHRV
jgi:hypothetical protein